MMRVVVGALACVLSLGVGAENPWVVYEGGDGPGAGKHIVLIAGDEEYRSEEALPQLGKILAKHHGFKCTVHFPIHPRQGYIDPNYGANIPGLEALENADLMIIQTRFRALPDEQMEHIDAYLKSGRPVIGIRTSTHAFKFPDGSKWEHYSDGYLGDMREWKGGFGRFILGEKWINHHGEHKHESALGIIAEGAGDHPIRRGIDDGDIWGPTDVYGVRLPLPGDSQPLVLGQVTKRAGEFDANDPLYGMRPTDTEPVEGEKNDPMMPVAWTKSYHVPGGEQGKVFTTTMGSSTDLLSEGLRRLLVQAAYWCVGLEDEIPEDGAKADLVGEFEPTAYAFMSNRHWRERDMRVSEHAME